MPTCKGMAAKGPCKVQCKGNYCHHHVGQAAASISAAAGGGGGGASAAAGGGGPASAAAVNASNALAAQLSGLSIGGASAAANQGNRVYSRNALTYPMAISIFTGGLPIEACVPEGRPYFILLYGAPGSGKSLARSQLATILGRPELAPEAIRAVKISCDILVESLSNFRANSRVVGEGAGSLKNKITASQKIYIKHLINKRLSENTGEEESLLDYRNRALDEAIAKGANIVYEKVLGNNLDKEQAEYGTLFARLSKYEIIVVRLTTSSQQIKTNLTQRPDRYMRCVPPFYRGVAVAYGDISFRAHNELYEKFLKQQETEGKIRIVTFKSGSEANGGGGGGGSVASGGGGGGGAERTRKRRNFRRQTRKI